MTAPRRYDPLTSAQAHVAMHNNALPGELIPAGIQRTVSEEEAKAWEEKFKRERDERIAAAADRRAKKRAKRLAAEHAHLDKLGVPRTGPLSLIESPTLENRRVLTLDERRALL